LNGAEGLIVQLSDFLSTLENSSLALLVSGSDLLFPIIETTHVLAIVMVVGTIMIVDLRLLHLASRTMPVTILVREVLPWTWTAFVVALITGGLMFISAAVKYSQNPAFLAKMAVLLLAGANMAIFHRGVYRKVADWDSGPGTPALARLAGAASLVIWVSVVALGRWIGFLE
jgi:hypothetical protein